MAKTAATASSEWPVPTILEVGASDRVSCRKQNNFCSIDKDIQVLMIKDEYDDIF
jgi:hypothetical protein